MLEIWDAERFTKRMTTGRTHPFVIGCTRQEHANSEELTRCDFVVKINGMPEVHPESLCRELLGNLIAREFGILTPKPALINISDEFVTILQLALQSDAITARIGPGLAAGTEYLPMSSAVIPVCLSEPQIPDAASIYAFDFLVQNPDRRLAKPNYGIHQGRICAFDFEMCFSFVLLLGGEPFPWKVSEHTTYNRVDKKHVFYDELRKRRIEWTPILSACENLNVGIIEALCTTIPAEWRSYDEKIIGHIAKVLERSSEFVEHLGRSLA